MTDMGCFSLPEEIVSFVRCYLGFCGHHVSLLEAVGSSFCLDKEKRDTGGEKWIGLKTDRTEKQDFSFVIIDC